MCDLGTVKNNFFLLWFHTFWSTVVPAKLELPHFKARNPNKTPKSLLCKKDLQKFENHNSKEWAAKPWFTHRYLPLHSTKQDQVESSGQINTSRQECDFHMTLNYPGIWNPFLYKVGRTCMTGGSCVIWTSKTEFELHVTLFQIQHAVLFCRERDMIWKKVSDKVQFRIKRVRIKREVPVQQSNVFQDLHEQSNPGRTRGRTFWLLNNPWQEPSRDVTVTSPSPVNCVSITGHDVLPGNTKFEMSENSHRVWRPHKHALRQFVVGVSDERTTGAQTSADQLNPGRLKPATPADRPKEIEAVLTQPEVKVTYSPAPPEFFRGLWNCTKLPKIV